ncbi:alkaline phosphatase [Staphylococcus condimenti]|uniref:DedA family protein n=1 Tax=Staphylococcus condimenti TaxID=70255 RepID=UPI000947823F|nr:DedA family protein [Staphylococcus condimenti]APR60184.1 alkaline phosphatase [Staphylococcus condimenti]
MEQILTDFISRWGYLAIFILILSENILPFVPSEVVLTFAGVLSAKSHISIWILLIVATVASFIGLLVLYYICRLVNEEKLYRFVDKYGKWIKLKGKDIKRANDWFRKYGATAVFLCRFVPVLRVLITIPVGISRMNVVTFAVLSLLGTTIWNFGLIYLGKALSDNWHQILNAMHTYSTIMLAILAVLFVIFAIRFISKRRKNSNAN